MKKLSNKLKYTTLALAIVVGLSVSYQAQAGFIFTPYDVPYEVTGSPLPPFANAGADKSVCLPITSVTITDAAVSDADGTIANAWWSFIDGPGPIPTISPLSTGPGASPMIIPNTSISDMTDPGVYDFKLTVMDNDGTTAEDNLIVTINAAGGCALEPNLVISVDPTPSSSPISGQATNIVAQVLNEGVAGTGIGFTNLFQFDNDADHTSSVTATDIGMSGALDAGSTSSISTSYTFTTAGTWYLRACADLDQSFNTAIPESDEYDNCGNWVPITVQDPNAPIVTIIASPTSGIVNVVNPRLTWGATNNPIACEASDDWSGSPGVSGNDEYQGVLTSIRTYTYTIRCRNALAGWGPTDSATVVVNSAVFSVGQCSSPEVAYDCASPAASIDRVQGTSSNPWTWTCPGTGGGGDAYCSEVYVDTKPECSDTDDDDGDSLIDNLDPGCHTDGKVDPSDPDITYDPLDDKEKNIKPIWIEI